MKSARIAWPILGLTSENPFVCNIWSKGMGREACHDNEPGGGGGGGNDPPKTITLEEHQKQIDKVVGQRLSEREKKLKSEHDAELAKYKDLEAQLAKLQEENELRGKSEEEKRKIEADKVAKALERERTEAAAKIGAAEKRAADYEAKLRKRDINTALNEALIGAKALPKALGKAVALMAQESTIELDDDGKVTSIAYGGVPYKTAAEAAAAFLKDNDFLASAELHSGGGTNPPNRSNGAPPSHNGSTEALLGQGLSQRLR